MILLGGLVNASDGLLVPFIFPIVTFPLCITSCTHSWLVSKCLTFPIPFLNEIPFAAEASVNNLTLLSIFESLLIADRLSALEHGGPDGRQPPRLAS